MKLRVKSLRRYSLRPRRCRRQNDYRFSNASSFGTPKKVSCLVYENLRSSIPPPLDAQSSQLTVAEVLEAKRLNDELNSINRQILQIKQSGASSKTRLSEFERQLQTARLAKEEWLSNTRSEKQAGEKPVRAENLSIKQLCALIPDQDTAFIKYDVNKHHYRATFVLMKTDADFDAFAQVKKIAQKNLLSEKIAFADGQTCSVNVYFNKGDLDDEMYRAWANDLAGRIPEFREQIARNSPAFKQNSKFIYEALIADGMPLFNDKKASRHRSIRYSLRRSVSGFDE